ncbi:MAG: glycosyltransferase family 4 protein [Chloroflexota bacterium]
MTQESPRLRIAFVYDALVPYHAGGAERRYHEIAIRLAARHDVHYVTWRYWGPQRTIQRDGITLHGVGRPRAFYGTDGKRTVREAAEFALRLPATLAGIRADVVDVSATPYLPLYAAWAATRVSGVPLIATWHEFWGEHWTTYLPDRPLVARIARLLEAGARPLADHQIAVSTFTARRLARGRRASRPIDVVGNGVDLAMMAPRRQRARGADVLFVGRLIDEKRVDLLIRAVGALAGRFPDVRCVIAGDGPERLRLTELATELGVADRVVFAGRVPDAEVIRLMRASRILVLPSIREGYGIAVVEGQACGLVPVVVRSPLSAAPDLVSDGQDGVVCEPTVAGLSDALGGLLAEPARLARMARAARRSAATRGWDDRALDMEQIYLHAVAARRHGFTTGPVAAEPAVAVGTE